MHRHLSLVALFFATLLGARAALTNDMFVNATRITGADYYWEGSNAGATAEPGEPAHATYMSNAKRSLWWTWTAPATGQLTFAVTNSSYSHFMFAAYAGEEVSNLTAIARVSTYSGEALSFWPLKGVSYHFVVDSDPGTITIKKLQFSFAASPENDDFANAFPTYAISNAVVVNTVASTLEPGETNTGINSVWWTWHAPMSGTATVEAPFRRVSVYTGTNLTNLVRIAYPYSPERVAFRAEAGREYKIAVSDSWRVDPNPSELKFWITPSPPNDMFSKRIRLTGTNATIVGYVGNATTEPGEPSGHSIGSTWWTWTAPGDGYLYFYDFSWSTPDLSVYTGQTLGTLTRVSSQGSRITVQAGVDYQIAVCRDLAQTLTAKLGFVPMPPNDHFADAIAISVQSNSVRGSTWAATREPEEPSGDSDTVWYTWTAQERGLLQLVRWPDNSQLDTYTNRNLSTLEYAATVYVGGIEYVNVEAGTPVHIRVSGAAGEFDLRWNFTPLPRPVNDHFTNASVLTDGQSVTGSRARATSEPNEPPLYYGLGTAWWSWTPASNCYATISLQSPAQTWLAVYSGTSLTNLAKIITAGPSSNFSPGVRFEADAGTTYMIQVGGGSSGGYSTLPLDVSLCVTAIPAPPNDLHSQATVLTNELSSITGQMYGARSEPGEPAHAGTTNTMTVWYSWTSATDGPVTVTAAATNFDIALAVYTGATVSNLTLVASNDNYRAPSTDSRVLWSATAGQTYWIAGAAPRGPTGYFLLSLARQTPPTISWAEPRPGPTFNAGADIMLAANASDVDGAIERVEFRINDAVVGTSISPPHTFTWRAALAGDLSAFAVAIDNDGNQSWTDPLKLSVRPENDLFNDRLTLSTNAVLSRGALASATMESGEPASAGLFTNSVWWAWTAVSNGPVRLQATNAASTLELSVFSGTDFSNFLEVARAADRVPAVTFHAEAGVTYAIRLAGNSNSNEIVLEVLPVIAGDAFSAPIVLSGASHVLSADLSQCSIEAGEPIHRASTNTRSMWFSWLAPADGALVIRSEPLPVTVPTIVIYTGSNIDGLTAMVTNTSWHWVSRDREYGGVFYPMLWPNTLVVDVEAGKVYQIAISASSGRATNESLQMDYIERAGNDDFANRTVLTGQTNVVAGDTTPATREGGEWGLWGDNRLPGTLWWSWIAPVDGDVLIAKNDDQTRAEVRVHTGTAMSNLVSIALRSDRNARLFTAKAGTTYQISVGGFLPTLTSNSTFGQFSYSLLQPAAPQNSTAPGFALTGYPSNVAGTTVNAIESPSSTDRVVYWTWTAPDTSLAMLIPATGQVPYGREITIYSNATTLARSGSFGGPIKFQAVAGRQYLIRVRDYEARVESAMFSIIPNQPPLISFVFPTNNATIAPGIHELTVDAMDPDGAITNMLVVCSYNSMPYNAPFPSVRFRRQFTAPPYTLSIPTIPGSYSVYAYGTDNLGEERSVVNSFRVTSTNDSFASATAMAGRAWTSNADATAATQEPGEPVHVPNRTNSLWWRWTAPVDGVFSVSTAGSACDTFLAAYTGVSVSNLTLIASNENASGTLASKIRIQAVAGVTYHLAVVAAAGWLNAAGSVQLSLQQVPANDDFEFAALLSGEGSSVTGTTEGATIQEAEPIHALAQGGASVWWRWTPTRSGLFRVSVSNPSLDSLLAIYSGPDFDTLTRTAYNDDSGLGGSSSVLFEAVAGTTYSIAVDGFAGAEGPFSLSIALEPFTAILQPAFVDGTITFQLSRNRTVTMYLQRSTNLIHWETVREITSAETSLKITEPAPTGPASVFYRTVEP